MPLCSRHRPFDVADAGTATQAIAATSWHTTAQKVLTHSICQPEMCIFREAGSRVGVLMLPLQTGTERCLTGNPTGHKNCEETTIPWG
jgi:hypothetical protein